MPTVVLACSLSTALRAVDLAPILEVAVPVEGTERKPALASRALLVRRRFVGRIAGSVVDEAAEDLGLLIVGGELRF
jgi:hypothetical protein